MRIVAGRHRGRSIAAPEDESVRPTSDRVRENLFNILAHGKFMGADGVSPLADAQVLDAFAGSGALGLEAVSRGAAHVVFLDQDLSALECIRRNVVSLREDTRSTLVQADALKPPPPGKVRGNPAPRDLVFLDPPYRTGAAAPALAALASAGWFAEDAIVVVELDGREPFETPDGFIGEDERSYGGTKVIFLRRAAKKADASP
jgi:16S rRNA (guanine966-N2)-methyltransferase